jgi:hypothetical protein
MTSFKKVRTARGTMIIFEAFLFIKKIPRGPCHKSLTLRLEFHLLALCNIHITLEKMRSTRRKLSFESNLEASDDPSYDFMIFDRIKVLPQGSVVT